MVKHSFHEGGIPPELEDDLAELYQNPFCLKSYFEVFTAHSSRNCLVLYDATGCRRQILVYALAGRKILILNRLIELQQEQLHSLAELLFRRYPEARAIHLDRVICTPKLSFPVSVWERSQDTVIHLPATVAEYRGRLGRRTRSNLNYYGNRLRNIHPDFSYQASGAGGVDPLVVGRIVEMNKCRMRNKNIKSGYDSSLTDKITRLSQSCGQTGTISINGKIIAGTLSYQVGEHCYLEAIAHDPAHDDDRVGQICLYLTIQQAIEAGRKFFHFLWGEYDYKYRFLGEKQDLVTLSVYRSGLHRLLSLDEALKHAATVALRKLVYWTRKYLVSNFKLKKS